LFDGIHLADGVGFLGAVLGRRGFATGGSRGLLVASEAALQRPAAGQVGAFGIELAQAQPQIGGSPGRMLFVQQQGLLQDRGQRRRGGRLVGRQQRRRALAREGLAQAADRAGRQVEALGNHGGRTALLPQGEDPLTDGEGQGSRHRYSRIATGRCQTSQEKNYDLPLTVAKPGVAISGQS
jgi:hypothetical protein